MSRGVSRSGGPLNQILSDFVLNPSLWKWLLFAGQPVRLAIAAHVFVGRSLRSLANEIFHRLTELVGWLYGRLRLHRLRGFERRYFAVRRWHVAVAVLATTSGLQLLLRSWTDRTSGRAARRKELRQKMLVAKEYREWCDAAAALESLSGATPAERHALEARLYDRRLLQERLRHLQRVRASGDVAEGMFAVRADLLRNLGNMTNAALHQRLLAVPEPIREYIEEVKTQLTNIAGAPAISVDDRLAFLRETRHAFGRTALVLSGGGSFGSFHLGVVKALLDAELLPRVVSGSSAGAVVASLICIKKDAELRALFSSLPEGLQNIDFYSSNTALQILKHVFSKGTLQDHAWLQGKLQKLLGEETFQEAYQKTGRILNVAVTAADTEEPPRLLNYLTAPNVIIWSAVACSSAFPFLFAPQQLLARDARGHNVSFANTAAGEAQRRWRDGSLEEDLPMRGLSEMFNVNYFLVSQCNPYLLPIIALKMAAPRTLGTLAEQEFKHRCKQSMELLPRCCEFLGASRVLKLLSQPWEGDVTMVLPVGSFPLLQSVINLSRDDIMRALGEGERATWAKLSAIRANCDIEVTLDSCLRQVTTAARRHRVRFERRASAAALVATGGGGGGGGLMRRGMPSWLHLQSLGIPHSDSADALGPQGLPHLHGLESLRGATSAADLGAADHGELPPRAAPAGMASVRSSAALQVDLTDTIVPEESELSAQPEDALGSGGSEGPESGGCEGVAAEAEAEAEAGPHPSPVSPRGRPPRHLSQKDAESVWRDLFQIAPATTMGDGLDYIAP